VVVGLFFLASFSAKIASRSLAVIAFLASCPLFWFSKAWSLANLLSFARCASFAKSSSPVTYDSSSPPISLPITGIFRPWFLAQIHKFWITLPANWPIFTKRSTTLPRIPPISGPIPKASLEPSIAPISPYFCPGPLNKSIIVLFDLVIKLAKLSPILVTKSDSPHCPIQPIRPPIPAPTKPPINIPIGPPNGIPAIAPIAA